MSAQPLPPERPPELGIAPPAEPLAPLVPDAGSWFGSRAGGPEPAPPTESAGGATALPGRAPLPPSRPAEFGGTTPAEPGRSTAEAGCLAELREAGATFAPAAQPGANVACLIDTPVQLTAVAEPGTRGGSVLLPDRPVVACRLALRFGEWVRAAAPVLARSRNAALVSVTTGPGWECRGRNRQRGAKLSAHANGLALDVNTFHFANRAQLPVSGHGADPAFAGVREAACGFFTTVLGPGSDAFHSDHLHLDIMRHGRDGSFRLCR